MESDYNVSMKFHVPVPSLAQIPVIVTSVKFLMTAAGMVRVQLLSGTCIQHHDLVTYSLIHFMYGSKLPAK